jgi:hypothetical protein
MSQRILKKLASKVNIKTSLPKIQLACSLSQYYRKQQIEKEQVKESYEEENCPICLDEFSDKPNNQSMTKCGHKFCTSCLMQHLRKNNNCPCCRTQLLEERQYPMHRLYRYPSGTPLVPNRPNMELLQPLELPPLPQIPYVLSSQELEIGEIDENIQSLTQLPTAPESEVMERNNMIEIVGDVTDALIEMGMETEDFDPYDLFGELSNIEDNINDFNHTLDNIMDINTESPLSIMRQVTPEPRITREAPPLRSERFQRNRGNITLRNYQEHFRI